jgi:hypothetical protein
LSLHRYDFEAALNEARRLALEQFIPTEEDDDRDDHVPPPQPQQPQLQRQQNGNQWQAPDAPAVVPADSSLYAQLLRAQANAQASAQRSSAPFAPPQQQQQQQQQSPPQRLSPLQSPPQQPFVQQQQQQSFNLWQPPTPSPSLLSHMPIQHHGTPHLGMFGEFDEPDSPVFNPMGYQPFSPAVSRCLFVLILL